MLQPLLHLQGFNKRSKDIQQTSHALAAFVNAPLIKICGFGIENINRENYFR